MRNEVERVQIELIDKHKAEFRSKLTSHLEMFKQEAKRLRMQLNSYKREFTSRDLTFLKLRDACAAQEFTLTHMKRYLHDQNMRMVYKLMGLQIPKNIREKLAKGGADFSDYFPVRNNTKPTTN